MQRLIHCKGLDTATVSLFVVRSQCNQLLWYLREATLSACQILEVSANISRIAQSINQKMIMEVSIV